MGAVFLRRAGVILAMSAGAAVTGPFGTFSDLTLLERLVYWPAGIAGAALSVIAAVGIAMARLPDNWHPVFRIAIGAFAAGPLAAALLLGLDITFRGEALTAYNIGFRWVFVFLIGFPIAVVETYVRPATLARHRAAALAEVEGAAAEPEPIAPTDEPDAPEPPLFLRNLDVDDARNLIRIETQDHYLDVVTSAGEHRILKRMSDAIAELNGFPGLQIHRSHWVALDAVERLEREGRKARVVLKNGDTIPVSRPNIPVVATALENR
ncbi:LytTR family DNA-binding domain-containing protein [Maritimibacter sp. UBA3975]|uniref:LytTR family DNA-binding domain-containing protein n=2 Tax=Maritimibacter TaxID=404235 RepID=UPI0025BE85F3|nr:LytTR family DNA-binding domain-containing protein [Maritimibacter sp. UBA3975]